MADAWGGSWGAAWGVSWGYSEESQQPGGGAASGPAAAGKRRNKHVEWLGSLPAALRRTDWLKRLTPEIAETALERAQKPRSVRRIGTSQEPATVAWRDEEEELLMILQACFATGIV